MSTFWRQGTTNDLSFVSSIGDRIHIRHPESEQVFAERVQLFPQGFFVLEDIVPVGYAISHPWLLGQPPKLNTLIGEIPNTADTFYIHDVAIYPHFRGHKYSFQVLDTITELAKSLGYKSLTGVAVNASFSLWQKLGFKLVDNVDVQSYGYCSHYISKEI